MAEVIVQSVEAGLADVFKYAYEANCQLEGELLSIEDRLTLSELSPIEVIENLKDLLESLLASKRELKKTDKAELVDRCEQFERQLQKLENDVRSHIRVDVIQVEQQLKLHAEATQAKLDELMKETEGRRSEEGREGLGDRESTDEDMKKTTPSASDWCPKGETTKDPCASHHRILSLERGVSEYKGDDRTRRLLDLAEKKHKSILSLEQECTALHFAFSQKRSEMESIRADYERILREMQLSRLKATKENIVRKQSSEKVGKRMSPDPMATDRQTPLKTSNGDRRSDHSPYLGTNHGRIPSKGRLEVSPIDGGRQKAHCRTTSDRGYKKVATRLGSKA